MCIKNNSSGQCFFIFWTTYNYIVLFVMHQSVTAVPLPTPPPRLPRGICLPYQSRGWALANFACPGGWAFANPRAPKFLTRMQYPNINVTWRILLKYKQIRDWQIGSPAKDRKILRRFLKAYFLNFMYAFLHCLSS